MSNTASLRVDAICEWNEGDCSYYGQEQAWHRTSIRHRHLQWEMHKV